MLHAVATESQALTQACELANQFALGEADDRREEIRTLEARISKAQRPAIVYNAALLLRVINEVRLAQQKPPEQVKSLLQAALTGVHVSPADDRIRFHGIDDVEMRRVELLSEGSFTELSPSAVCDLTFPLPRAHRQAQGFSSFIITETRQSLSVLVPRVNDVRNRPRGQAGLASRH